MPRIGNTRKRPSSSLSPPTHSTTPAASSNSSVAPSTPKNRRDRAFVTHVSLPSYADSGDAIHVCPYCSALFWTQERLSSNSSAQPFKYNQCCRHGTVFFPPRTEPPPIFSALFSVPAFMEKIRAYNNMFAMTSFGAEIDDKINDGSGPYVFKIVGQISHWIGSFCPLPGQKPHFLQLYIYDTENEVSNRLENFPQLATNSLSHEYVSILSRTLHVCNEYIRLFKTASELLTVSEAPAFAIRLFNDTSDNRYSTPAPGTLGGIVRDATSAGDEYDIIIHHKDGNPRRVSKLHPSYMPLQYPLLFPYAEQGWSPQLRLRSSAGSRSKKLTTNMYYSYYIHDRHQLHSHLLHGGRLFQQYLVDAYTCIEQGRLDYISAHQSTLRCEYASGVYDALSSGDADASQIGMRVFLPSSFTGGPRYMYKHYQDALAICRVHGNPQYFITFTCNARWPEIDRHLQRVGAATAQDRPDIIARLFQIKVLEMLRYIRTDRIFGEICADLYTIEFQKRGLPHCHTLIWVTEPFKIRSPTEIDRYITAELPDSASEPFLYRMITECMMHGPCGLPKPFAPCIREHKCSKKFPKDFSDVTSFDKSGFVIYRRRRDQRFVLKGGLPLDNAYVVPYNKHLCSKFAAHINVEYCGWAMLIKYLFKYIAKGTDRVRFSIVQPSPSQLPQQASTSQQPLVNEVRRFLDGPYICLHEAVWRILNFDIHERHPSVLVFSVHLEGMQNATFRSSDQLHSLVSNPSFGKTTLTEWMHTNTIDVSARSIKYEDFPSLYRWDLGKFWVRRARKHQPQIGRLIYVHPSAGELFFLRMLLCHRAGCCSYIDLQTVDSVLYATFKSTCQALGLVGDDREWLSAFVDASIWATVSELRSLFVHLMLFCDVGQPIILWETHWRKMSDDILLRLQSTLVGPLTTIAEDDLKQFVLLELEVLLNGSTPSKILSDFGLPLPSADISERLQNRLLLEETSYDRESLSIERFSMVSRLNESQLKIYNIVVSSFESKRQSLLFVYGHGGTGKTFLWSTIIAHFRSLGHIVLVVAASGIASLLLPSGRTAHSRFKIPIDFTDRVDCGISKNSQLASLLQKTTVIIWDEAPMNDRRCFECLDKSLQDITGNTLQPFGGKTVLLGGDFRQTLPVKPKCSSSQIIESSLPRSSLWPHFGICKLTENMRLRRYTATDSRSTRARTFAHWLLAIGDGILGYCDSTTSSDTKNVEIPEDFLFPPGEANLKSLINFIYDPDTLSNPTATNMSNRAIVCPKNDTANDINDMILGTIIGESRTYFSHDVITPHTQQQGDIATLYPDDYLHQMNFAGIPPHNLTLKINVPIILLRNMNQTLGLCNGTRLLVTQLLPNVIEALIITGTAIGKRVYIPRIKFIHNDKELPFVFSRRQYPVRICYAMTINKSQGQSLDKIGVYLKEPVFTHGQLYVAFSRATSPDAIKIVIESDNLAYTSITKNVVFSDFIDELNKNINILHSEYMATVGVGLLTEGSKAHLIEIRVIRKWRPRPKNQDTFYIFVDKQGDAIQAFCASKDQMVVDAKLQISRCYQIKGYACISVEKNNKVIPNDVSIRIGPATSITSNTDIPDIPRHYFCFGDYDDIRDMYMGHDKIIDYLGVLESIEDGKTKKTSKSYVNLKITDSSNESIRITLWDEIATLFERFPRTTIQSATKPTVIAATSVKFNKYTGSLDLQSTAATHIYLISEHPAKEELLKRYNPKLIQTTDQLTLYASKAEKTTVSELAMKEHPLPPEKNFMCEAFITEFVTNDGWYYAGCKKCKGTAHKSGDSWFCTDCGDINDVTYKSRIVAFISDGFTQLKVAMFDDTLTLLLEKPLHSMIAIDGYDDNTCLPGPISKIRGERRLFCVAPQREQYNNTPRFIVKQILSLDFFDKPLAIEPPPSTPKSSQLEVSETPIDTTPNPPLPTPSTTTKNDSQQPIQTQDTPSDTVSYAKRKIDFDSQGTSSPISDTKHIRYKD